jgi:hypothetical protein
MYYTKNPVSTGIDGTNFFELVLKWARQFVNMYMAVKFTIRSVSGKF